MIGEIIMQVFMVTCYNSEGDSTIAGLYENLYLAELSVENSVDCHNKNEYGNWWHEIQELELVGIDT